MFERKLKAKLPIPGLQPRCWILDPDPRQPQPYSVILCRGQYDPGHMPLQGMSLGTAFHVPDGQVAVPARDGTNAQPAKRAPAPERTVERSVFLTTKPVPQVCPVEAAVARGMPALPRSLARTKRYFVDLGDPNRNRRNRLSRIVRRELMSLIPNAGIVGTEQSSKPTQQGVQVDPHAIGASGASSRGNQNTGRGTKISRPSLLWNPTLQWERRPCPISRGVSA